MPAAVIDADTDSVALTGVGAVTPLSHAATTGARLLAGDSGLNAAPEVLLRAGRAAAGPARVSPLFTPIDGADMAACQPSIVFSATGPVLGGVGACAAGVQAVIDALRMVQRGDAEVVLAGATDGALSPMLLGGSVDQ